MSLPSSHNTYLHVLGPHSSFLGSPRHRRSPSAETLDDASRAVYPLDGNRKGVAKWSLLLVCVWLGHSNKPKQGWTKDSIRFPGLDLQREFRSIRCRNLHKCFIACTRVKAMHASEVGTVSPIPPKHLPTCARATCKFSRDPEAPKPPFRRNPRRCVPRRLPT